MKFAPGPAGPGLARPAATAPATAVGQAGSYAATIITEATIYPPGPVSETEAETLARQLNDEIRILKLPLVSVSVAIRKLLGPEMPEQQLAQIAMQAMVLCPTEAQGAFDDEDFLTPVRGALEEGQSRHEGRLPRPLILSPGSADAPTHRRQHRSARPIFTSKTTESSYLHTVARGYAERLIGGGWLFRYPVFIPLNASEQQLKISGRRQVLAARGFAACQLHIWLPGQFAFVVGCAFLGHQALSLAHIELLCGQYILMHREFPSKTL